MSVVVPCRFLEHVKTGKRISLYSAIPEGMAAEWQAVQKGWTVQHPDGTTGLGRAPFDTAEEAQAWCDAHPNFPGMMH